MKITLFIPILLLSSCIAERDFIVGYDYSYRGNFKKYDTYDFIVSVDTVHFNGLSDRLIREEIEKRLTAQGYRKADRDPSFYIVYKVFGGDLAIKSYEQMELNSWDQQFGEKELDDRDLEDIEEAVYDPKQVALRNGTLLIDFVDRKTQGVIWQGYASGLFDQQSYVSKDVKYAVRSILNQYRLIAAGYQ